ncbi:hypothetical protein SAMN05216389_11111 [Oceanobacillus limi]|uniref:Uncharacterized protein n=1 Tax=Oceanobacillus limi TaxID=930131 RepID=A0A1I0EAM7_9BACI|nr:hypothetical protein [Oceanobacillus limi]SET42194.1 hypothetical protein SAMN05216389_11111 [Oceanobacillus limi]
MSKYSVGDVVRTKDRGLLGLWEVTNICDIARDPDSFDYDYMITDNECDSEIYVRENDLILVCKVEDRRDIDEGVSK